MEYSRNSTKTEVYSNIGPLQETRKYKRSTKRQYKQSTKLKIDTLKR